ncbi:MAG: DUF4837 family protein [Paludibacteraceae bacterium]|nr:DUF4837 family protein [Paludibacteraceae bacterium]
MIHPTRHILRPAALLAVLLAIAGCTGHFSSTTATGGVYELLIVMDTAAWNGAAGDTTRAYLAQPMPNMPQADPTFKLSHVTWAGFTDIVKPVRNILLADINPKKYTKTVVGFSKNKWAGPQRVVTIQAPDAAEYAEIMSLYGQRIVDYLVRSELERQVNVYRSKNYSDEQTAGAVARKMGVSLAIPKGYRIIKDTTNLIWLTDARSSVRRDLIVYATPERDATPLTLNTLIQRRDSVMSQTVTDQTNGYMSTECIYDRPTHAVVMNMDSVRCDELRGLWKMNGGLAMGGPFVSHTILDTIQHRHITVEGFVYAPGKDKRTPIRQLEAIASSMRLVQRQ